MQSQPMQSEVWNLPKVCKSFPEFDGKLIDRDHVLTQVEAFFSQGHKLVVFEGDQGAGSTTLLAQFALAHPNHAISLFIKTSSRIAYDPDSLREDLCQQLYWTLEGDEIPDSASCDELMLRSLLNRLARKARSKNEHFFFLVDGLDKIPDHEAQLTKQIGAMIPWGMERFRVLLSGEVARLPIPLGNTPKTSPVPYFSLEEVVQFFEGVVERPSAQNIYRNFKVPGQLATVRRLLLDSHDPSRLLNNLPQTHPRLFQLEWDKTTSRDAEQALLLALLAHDRRDHTISDLARVTKTSPHAVQNKLSGLSFIEIKPRGENGESVEWVSEDYRDFAARQLHTWKNRVQEIRIDELIKTLRTPSTPSELGTASAESLIELTSYLEEADRPDDLLTYLNPETLAQMLDRSHSLALVQRKASAGIEAAVRTRRDSDLMHLSIQKATLSSLEGAKVWRSEIEAQIALDDFAAAQALTQATVLHADRLHQLAVIAKARH